MPLIETKGAASAQGFGEFLLQSAANYIEDVFSTYIYTGNGSSQTITNGIDLTGKGGLVWIKERSVARDHYLFDTVRGVYKALQSNTAAAELTVTGSGLSAFTSSGFTLTDSIGRVNESGQTYVSWTFREQPKFFDIQTFTVSGGTGSATFSHNLGSTPGCIFIKNLTGGSGSWIVYHRSLTAGYVLLLNLDWAQYTPGYTIFTSVTSTSVSVDQYFNDGNYVAYLFAHNAGGFGLTGSDNVISCGAVTRSGSAVIDVNLGYEPQWVLFKSASNSNNWRLFDNMRGMPVAGTANVLNANLADAEGGFSDSLYPTATGFAVNPGSGIFGGAVGSVSIYIAIRRGPMKVPTSGTSVFSPVTFTASGTTTEYSAGFPIDLMIDMQRNAVNDKFFGGTRLTGLLALKSNSTAAEQTYTVPNSFTQNGFTITGSGNWVGECLGRAPSFFDVVCYTGTGSATTQAHNLGVVPEMIIAKNRSTSGPNWQVYHSAYGPTLTTQLNLDNAQNAGTTVWNSTTPTASVFSIGTSGGVNTNGDTYVAYLFATCAGVSKVGSYTGTGALQTINCGFTGGARFVLIKRTDSTGDWYVYDSARGISSGNDPYLFLNSTAAEVTGTNYVDTTSVGFQVTAAAPAGLNANGGTYIFLAIA